MRAKHLQGGGRNAELVSLKSRLLLLLLLSFTKFGNNLMDVCNFKGWSKQGGTTIIDFCLVAQIIDFQSQCPNMAQLTPASSLLVQ
jgi:hypothetical protein